MFTPDDNGAAPGTTRTSKRRGRLRRWALRASGRAGSATATFEGDAELEPPRRWARLCIVHPRKAARIIDLGEGRTVIGREGPQVKIDESTLSRQHFELRIEGGSVAGVDLGSRNGSTINGVASVRLPRALQDGDVLRFGEVVAVLEIGQGPFPEETAKSSEEVPGESAAAARVRATLAAAVFDPSPVLVSGETGTGKEWVAKAVHRNGARCNGPFVTTNCAALTKSLIESQLFGHEKGAFTGATGAESGLFRAADGGTLFLDEIGELPLDLQAKLLRAVELGEIHPLGAREPVQVFTRVVAATNRDLLAEVEAGRFRRDLLARLSLIEIELPPLRGRRADIMGWVDRLHARWLAQRELDAPPLALSAEAVEAILLQPWPENLRGLDHLVHVLAAQGAGGTILRADLAFDDPSRPHAAKAAIGGAAKLPPRARPSKRELEEALRDKKGNIAAVATHFGRARRQIYRWMEHYAIERER